MPPGTKPSAASTGFTLRIDGAGLAINLCKTCPEVTLSSAPPATQAEKAQQQAEPGKGTTTSATTTAWTGSGVWSGVGGSCAVIRIVGIGDAAADRCAIGHCGAAADAGDIHTDNNRAVSTGGESGKITGHSARSFLATPVSPGAGKITYAARQGINKLN